VSEDAVFAALDALDGFEVAAERDPLELHQPTIPQLALYRCADRRVLLRTGNQIGGKTTAACVLALWWATWRHPYQRTPRRAVHVLFVCVSWTQSLAIQGKLWALCPKQSLKPGQSFDPTTGFGTKAPALEFVNGSVISIRTENQGAKQLAGSTVDLIIYDEPPKSQRLYSELDMRLVRKGGTMVLTMTPVNARIDWLREMAEAGKITDLHFRGDPANCVLPDGTFLTVPNKDTLQPEPMDAAWFERHRWGTDPREEPVIIDGEWEFRAVKRFFEGWDPSRFVVPQLLDSAVGPGERTVTLRLGVDYGDDRLRTAAVLIAIYEDLEDDRETRLWVLGEYVPDRATNVEQDAEGILGMLAALGLRWSDLSEAYGDKKYTDASGQQVKKSNGLLGGALARQLGHAGGIIRPPLLGAKRVKGVGRLGRDGALFPSARWLHDIMLRGQLWVDRSCVRVLKAFDTWDGTEKHETKDALDGVRYAAVQSWARRRVRKAAPQARLY
jgi:hypothetical protein